MYPKFGIIYKTQKLVNMMYDANITSWNAMTRGYAIYGYKDDLKLFDLIKLCLGNILNSIKLYVFYLHKTTQV